MQPFKKFRMKKILFQLLTLALFTPALAQNQPVIPCFTDEQQEEYLQAHPELKDDFRKAFEEIADQATNSTSSANKAEAVVRQIPVVFHVIYNTPYDNISKAQILDGLRILNEDWRRQNPDASSTRAIFQSRAADMEVEFVLAKRGPDSNCTDGINRIESPLSVQASPRDQVKSLIQWNPKRYLNVWVVNSIENSSSSGGVILGYANFPWMPASRDGIVIRHDALGRIGTSNYDGRTLSHEAGHYLGLLHTFQSGCNGGDGVNDTPPVASASYGCNLNKNSCSNDSPNLPDMIENFMDYSDGECQNTFTQGQKSLVQNGLNNYNSRQELYTQTNLEATGVINPPACRPIADFYQTRHVVCQGDVVQFYDESEDGTPDSYSWVLPGATPNNSSDQNPTVTYDHPGAYNVTLTVTNVAGTSSKTIENTVFVRPTWSTYQAQWSEDFESDINSNPDLSVFSTYDSVEFKVTNQAATSGSQSLSLNNFNPVEPKDIDVLYSPVISTIFGKDINMSFDYAYAQRAGNELDLFRVYISTNCGQSWAVLRSYTAFTLRTANPTTSEFIPSPSEWKSSNINLSGYEDKGPILLKFQFTGAGGNNFYLDNINLTSSNIGLDEQALSAGIAIYPNPAKGYLNIDFAEPLVANASLSITDLNGKSVYQKTISKQATEARMDNLNLAAGVYIISINGSETMFTQKLIIE